eukprot:2370266-Prymnesium_polylepis.1
MGRASARERAGSGAKALTARHGDALVRAVEEHIVELDDVAREALLLPNHAAARRAAIGARAVGRRPHCARRRGLAAPAPRAARIPCKETPRGRTLPPPGLAVLPARPRRSGPYARHWPGADFHAALARAPPGHSARLCAVARLTGSLSSAAWSASSISGSVFMQNSEARSPLGPCPSKTHSTASFSVPWNGQHTTPRSWLIFALAMPRGPGITPCRVAVPIRDLSKGALERRPELCFPFSSISFAWYWMLIFLSRTMLGSRVLADFCSVEGDVGSGAPSSASFAVGDAGVAPPAAGADPNWSASALLLAHPISIRCVWRKLGNENAGGFSQQGETRNSFIYRYAGRTVPHQDKTKNFPRPV